MKHRSPANAFSLVEVTLALGVASFCLVAIFGLLPVGIQTNRTAIEQTAATAMLSSVISDLRATPSTVPKHEATESERFEIPIPANPVASDAPEATLFFDAEGDYNAEVQADSRYRLIVSFPPNGPSPQAATLVKLRITWPAQALPAAAEGSVEMVTALDRN